MITFSLVCVSRETSLWRSAFGNQLSPSVLWVAGLMAGPRTLSLSHLADTLFSAFIDLCSRIGKIGIWMFVCFFGMLKYQFIFKVLSLETLELTQTVVG